MFAVAVVALGSALLVSDGGFRLYPLGRLPGDIVIRRESFTFYLPLMTSILLSVLLSAIFWGIGRIG
ncbi:DUF2905 domain-containing protein [Gloeobacter kilaueensis]|uniref:DUF2905 domain-containing protein n=1 Tax=Gloeobacter kilaueensis TaxID=1416614 RepID=UPI001CB73C88|nr:DUF2905 domain-containing protein [Gloeobacter kilaueensis]